MKVIKENDRQRIVLLNSGNRKVLQRQIFDDKWEFYKTLQQINHPNIPKILNVEFNTDTVVTEEYIEGKSLAALIEENYRFSKKQIKLIIKQLASAIEELHKHNIIHRDIKPDNIIMNKSGHIWLIDYDIARIYRDETRKDTEVMGTFGYAPIEQFGMLPTDFKTDIYAFGVTVSKIFEVVNIKGYMMKVAEKCKRLDPSQRYQSMQEVKRALSLSAFVRVAAAIIGICAVAVLSVTLIFLALYEEPLEKDDIPNKGIEVLDDSSEYVKVDDELLAIMNFEGFELSEKDKEFLNSDFSESADIFTVDELWAHLPFIEDVKKSGIIYMGKEKGSNIKAEAELKDGVLSLCLEDDYGHSFSKDFSYNPENEYTLSYTNDRRQNAELICRDLDGDFVEELLVGINDCSFKMVNNKVFCYFNYSQAWCIKYDEARGFTLCEGEMFSDNSKFAIFENDLKVHLPVYSINEDGRCGYELKGTKIVPFY